MIISEVEEKTIECHDRLSENKSVSLTFLFGNKNMAAE
jgi:hypothetical protein